MHVKYINLDCTVRLMSYGNGRPGLRLFDRKDGFPVATATVNLTEIPLSGDEVALKNYSENEGILEVLVNAGVVELTEREIHLPNGTIIPICRLNRCLLDDKLAIAS